MDVAKNNRRAGVKVAALIPAYNEEKTIQSVVNSVSQNLPDAITYVYDNNSTDNTVKLAEEVRANVIRHPVQGKGNVVRKMFADIDADIFVLVDADATYDLSVCPEMINILIKNKLDMVVGVRQSNSKAAFPPGHRFGNKMLNSVVQNLFGRHFDDMLSGYRVFSKRYVKSFPSSSAGFEIETEMTVHALEMKMATAEYPTHYFDRPEGSQSKLSTYADGIKILKAIFSLFKVYHPLRLFGVVSLLLMIASIGFFMPVLTSFLETGQVLKIPTVILSTGLMLLSFLTFSVGLILQNVSRLHREMKHLFYLNIK